MEHKIKGPSNIETFGESPNTEKFEDYHYGSKLMELSFFENGNRFEIFIKKIDDEEKISGETTALFAEMVKKMKTKANELGQPVKLFTDPVNPIIEAWLKTKAADVIGGWDEIKNGNYIKWIQPEKL